MLKKLEEDKEIDEDIIWIDKINNKVGLIRNRKRENINWIELKELFKKGQIEPKVLVVVGKLRRKMLNIVLNELNIIKNCYYEFGSLDLTSDLDFTYVNYNNLEENVKNLKLFYNKMKDIFGNYPDVVFDTNYYLTSSIIDINCYNEISNDRIRSLFTEIRGKYYRLYGYINSDYHRYDILVCNLIQKILLKGVEKKLVNMIRYSVIYFRLLKKLETEEITDEIRLLLRTLYHMMACYSNESYVSDITVLKYVFNIDLPCEGSCNQEEINSIIYNDNYLFIDEWYKIYKEENRRNYIYFFDIVCKYIIRCSKIYKLNEKLVEISNKWRNEIRGKISLETIIENKEEENIRELQTIYPTIKSIYEYMTKYYETHKIRLEERIKRKIYMYVYKIILIINEIEIITEPYIEILSTEKELNDVLERIKEILL
jgi:hypothetical protein